MWDLGPHIEAAHRSSAPIVKTAHPSSFGNHPLSNNHEVDKGFPNRKVVLQNPSISFYDCTYWLLRRWLDLGSKFGHVLRGRGKISL